MTAPVNFDPRANEKRIARADRRAAADALNAVKVKRPLHTTDFAVIVACVALTCAALVSMLPVNF